jgi:hypothetical protein
MKQLSIPDFIGVCLTEVLFSSNASGF